MPSRAEKGYSQEGQLSSRTTRYLLLGLLATTSSLLAQTGLATLTGTVTDQTGAVMSGVTITAKQLATGAVTTAASSETGNYTIPQLRVGDYEVSVEQTGFKSFKREGLTLSAGQVMRVDIQMEVGATTESVRSLLTLLVQQGHVQFFEARGLYKLSTTGLDVHSTWLADQLIDDTRSLFHQSYSPFLELNSSFKELCSSWQSRYGAPNDHSDADYDARCIAELGGLLSRSLEVLAGFAAASRRFDLYAHRLRAAHSRLEAGDTRMFTGVMCGSFHDVWMELHEDLVQLLGIDRVQEGSF